MVAQQQWMEVHHVVQPVKIKSVVHRDTAKEKVYKCISWALQWNTVSLSACFASFFFSWEHFYCCVHVCKYRLTNICGNM